ncbi:hypothetical protein GTQ99_18350 [Kineococcus sp. T13]|uniref:hypothetical protein n=1 Tax=Kineococcus vitellinus TaxID=2696565 RepID=UPI0014123A6F|nr:hypothetical protein [Kineococcus vitellinus]NAZ77367.1 hypothetical protein [Kineococcus vitellinus]
MSEDGLPGRQLYSQLAGLLAPAGTPAGTGVLLLVEPAGKDLDPADFSADSAVSAEAFSDLVNPIPVPAATYVDSGRRLDDLAMMVLRNATVVPDSPSATAASLLLSDARADLELMVRASSTPGDLYRPANASPSTWWQDGGWGQVSFTVGPQQPPAPLPPVFQAPPVVPRLAWKRLPRGLEATSPTVRLMTGGKLSMTSLRALELAQPVVEPTSGRRLGAVPRAAALLQASEARTAVHAGVEVGTRTGSFRQLGGRKRMIGEDGAPVVPLRLKDALLESRAIDAVLEETPAQPPGGGVSFSFSYKVVDIDRPWWHPEVFDQPGWSMPGFPEAAVSTGTPADNPGLIGVVTTRMLVVRDLRISGEWSGADGAAAAGAQQELGAVGLGPFALTGDVGWDGTTLSRPGMQVVAWTGVLTRRFPAAPAPG